MNLGSDNKISDGGKEHCLDMLRSADRSNAITDLQ